MSDSDDKKLDNQINEGQMPSEVAKKESVFIDQNKQGTWTQATEDYRTSKHESATMEALSHDKLAEVQAKGDWNKFEIVGLDDPENQHRRPTKSTIKIGNKDYPSENVISRDWGASLKKGFERAIQTVQHHDLFGWENSPSEGDAFYPRRGREDDFIDFDASAKANKAFPKLAKYIGEGNGKVDPDLIAATIRNEQFHFDNGKDAGPENYAQKHGNWPFNQDESLGPAQIQVQNMEHLAKTYPNQLGSVDDAVKNGIDKHRAPYFVGAYFSDVITGIETGQKPDYISNNIWKQINEHWQNGRRNEALIIAYNPDPKQINHIFTQLDNIKAPDWD